MISTAVTGRWPGWLLLMLWVASAAPVQARQADPAPRLLKVATLELPTLDEGQWEQRRDQVLQMLETLQPDVIAVQRVMQAQAATRPAGWPPGCATAATSSPPIRPARPCATAAPC